VLIRRLRWVVVAASIGVLTLAAAIGIATRIPFSSDALRMRLIAVLSDRLDAEVELRSLTLRVYPRLRATGEGLTVRFQHRIDAPPLVSIDRFNIEADLLGLWRRQIARVALTGLAINIPPDTDDEKTEEASSATESDQSDTPISAAARDFVIDELDAPDAQLTILRSDPEKAPRVWYLHRLQLHRVGLTSKMPFDALLTNAVPPGQITTSGTFGPWHRVTPGATPLDGRFTFDNADLSVFKGISGVLSARGSYQGTLNRIVVDGETDTPDFMVNLSGHAVPLHTTYRAIVNATNGNTTLDPVSATVLETPIVAKGGVYEVEGVHGRVVKLDVSIEDGRLEDVMRMSVATPKPPMSGTLQLSTTLTIPPGDQDIVEKLQLGGRFAIEDGRFTDRTVQNKIDALSLRARGRTPDGVTPVARVTSDFSGRFALANGRLSLSQLAFDVPGAVVSVNGAYSLRRETLAFTGDLIMDARLSQTVTGFKSLLLKVADPIFRRNGKTHVPLKISGTRNDPQFGLDMKRVFRR
jgi:hypothetical protein